MPAPSRTEEVIKLPRGALLRLKRADPVLGRLIDRVGPFAMTAGRGHHLEALMRSIVYQQLSGKAAATIFGRVRALFPAGRFPTAARILARTDEELRGCGLSAQKLSYVRDLCSRVHDGRLDLASLDTLPDDEAMERLVEVRGFGRWSAEMFLMFQLGRLDLWPVDDLAVRKALVLLHGLPESISRKELDAFGERYRPYRSVVSWYLWRLFDLPPEDRAAVCSP
jgi:3-methyladenine DNA glycosylase/8-oxoguanine DNA glycosylase